MIKVIDKKVITNEDGNPDIVEITILERLFFINFKRVFRKVEHVIFRYKNKRYKEISWLYDSDVKNYFLLPVENENKIQSN